MHAHVCARAHTFKRVKWRDPPSPLPHQQWLSGPQEAKFSQNWRASPAYVLSTRKDVYAQIRTCVNLRVTPSMPWACARFSEVS